MKQEPFKIDLENWHLIKPKTMQFIFTECEKRLQASITTNINNRQAAYRLLGILLPVVTLSAGYLLTHGDWQFFGPAMCFLVVELIGVLLLTLSLRAQPIMPLGAEPKTLIDNSDYIEYPDEKMEDWQFVGISINYCASIQDRIDHNEARNSAIARKVNISLWLCGIVAPSVFMLIALLVKWHLWGF